MHQSKLRCAGNPGLACGGAGEVFVHELPTADREWLGCVRDDGTVFPRNTVIDNMTPDTCRDWAALTGAKYYGMQGGNTCFAGDMMATALSQLEPYWDQCMVPCTGNTGRACGGPEGEATSVYGLISGEDEGGW